MKVLLVTLIASLSVGCVGFGFSVSPADGEVALKLKALDCISDNVAGRTLQAIPKVGDWAMIHWGCTEGRLVDPVD